MTNVQSALFKAACWKCVSARISTVGSLLKPLQLCGFGGFSLLLSPHLKVKSPIPCHIIQEKKYISYLQKAMVMQSLIWHKHGLLESRNPLRAALAPPAPVQWLCNSWGWALIQ